MIRPAIRRQIRIEIRAQFESFRATGFVLDHVNAHQHYHLHPAILDEVLNIGRDYGMKALRVPFEPIAFLRDVEPTHRSIVTTVVTPWAALMRGGLARPDSSWQIACLVSPGLEP
jgi:chitin disaccharide deacetylase